MIKPACIWEIYIFVYFTLKLECYKLQFGLLLFNLFIKEDILRWMSLCTYVPTYFYRKYFVILLNMVKKQLNTVKKAIQYG